MMQRLYLRIPYCDINKKNSLPVMSTNWTILKGLPERKIHILVIPMKSYLNSLNNKMCWYSLLFCNTTIVYGIRFIAEMTFSKWLYLLNTDHILFGKNNTLHPSIALYWVTQSHYHYHIWSSQHLWEESKEENSLGILYKSY